MSDSQTVRPWDVRTGKPAGKPLEAVHVNALAFTSDGKTLATGGADQVIRLWDVKEGREKSPTAGHHGRVYAAAVAPDGRTVATVGGDATIRLWDRATGRERGQIVKPRRYVSALAFTPDGRGLLTTEYPLSDETVRLWDAAAGKELRRFAGASAVVHARRPAPCDRLQGWYCPLLAAGYGERAAAMADFARVSRTHPHFAGRADVDFVGQGSSGPCLGCGG